MNPDNSPAWSLLDMKNGDRYSRHVSYLRPHIAPTSRAVAMLTLPDREFKTYLEIADYIETQILAGELRPNDQLPTTTELLELFQVSRDTIQRALTRLVRRGLIKRTPSRGSHVTAGVASSTVAIVLGNDPFINKSGFYRNMLSGFFREGTYYNLHIKSFIFLDDNSFLTQIRELENDIREGRLRCIVTFFLSGLLGHWLEDHKDLPYIHPPDTDIEARAYLGMKHLLERNYTKPLFLSLASVDATSDFFNKQICGFENKGIQRAWKESGVSGTPPEPICISATAKSAYDYVRQALTSSSTRPDAIFVNHDLNTQGVLYALTDLGLRMPEDVALITHENAGSEHYYPRPLTRLVVDPLEQVRQTFSYIRQGGISLPPGCHELQTRIKPRLVVGQST